MKALLVDDEHNVRDCIRYLGQWDQLGITEILEASNGEEAKEIIERENPEIVFTDIKMPRLNGIELIEWLNAFGYHGKVIIISGYDDYSYMRKAIQLNTYDYLLKPIKSDALNQVLSGAVAACNQEEKERRNWDSSLDKEVKRLRYSEMITAACEGHPFDPEALSPCLPAAKCYELTLITFYYGDNPDPFVNRLSYELVNKGWGNAFSFQMDPNQCVIISVHGKLQLIEEWMNGELKIPARMVVGEPFQSLSELPASFQSAKNAMEAQQFRTIHRFSEQKEGRRINDIVAYVKEHFSEELSLDQLASLFFLSREHISRKFKQEQGMTLSSYLIQLRIEHAKRWLCETDEKMYAISLMLGYQHEKHFSKLFKKIVGMTPLEYRCSHRKQQASED